VPAIANGSTAANVPRHGRGVVVWFTGLSGAGKTSIADGLAAGLVREGRRVEVLDGDRVRPELSQELGFSRTHRDINVTRIAFVAELLSRNGVIVLVAAISPYRAARDDARRRIRDFVEVHVATPIETCIERDVKGLYRRALAGELPRFTGLTDPYEAPLAPEHIVDTSTEPLAASVARVRIRLVELGHLPVPGARERPGEGVHP
jgi:adenylyl-sulfate kinase